MGNDEGLAVRQILGTGLLLLAAGSHFVLPAVLSLGIEDFVYTLPGLILFALPILALLCATGRAIQRELCFLTAALGLFLVIFTGPLVLLTVALYAVAGALTPEQRAPLRDDA